MNRTMPERRGCGGFGIDTSNMSLIFYLIRHSRNTLLVAIATSIISGLSSAGLVALINQALGVPMQRLAELGLRFLGLSVLVLITRAISSTLFMRLGQSAKATLRMDIIRRIGDAPYQQLEKQGGARALSILTDDLDTIVVFFVSLPNLAMQGAVITGCLIYLGYLSWQILLFAVATVLIGSLGFHLVNSRAEFHLRSSRRREDELVKHFRALFDGAKELKLHRRRKSAFIDGTLATNVEAVRVQRTRGYVLYAAAASWGSFIFFAFIGCVLFVLTQFFPVSNHVMSGYAVIFLYMIMPIEGLLSALPTISSAKVAIERIDAMHAELRPEQTLAANDAVSFERIVLGRVTHRYYREKEDGVFTLGPIDLSFAAGEIVFLIGGNGSGKTTLAKLITGLYAPDSGRVLLDGQTVDERAREAYRQHFSVVFSDFFLFDSLLGMKLDGLDREAKALLEALHLDHKVKIENGVFSTTELSQGQRKRLALLVAYLEDRPFYLFDEWAADQDPLFKETFYRSLLPELKKKGKAVLVISHDDRYFYLADRYVKLEYGQLVEQGAGADLSPSHVQSSS